MKRIALLFVSVFVGAVLMNGQTSQTPESLQKASAKSDEDINNPKKNVKAATWEKRGDLFLDIAQFNTKGLFVGMQQKGITGVETMIGKPQSINGDGGVEDWVYERITLHFENGELKSWDETKPLDNDALNKSYEAYLKADELDPKFSKKSSAKINIASLRGLLTNKGVQYFGEKKYSEATVELKKALRLYEFPKEANDTLYNGGLVTYYVGVIAQSGKDFKTAKEYYNICIDKGYEGATPYQALASLYKEEGNSEKELEILQTGRAKYPDSREILIGFINYYLTSGQSELALEQLNKAVKDNPENPSFHYAIGTLYDTMVKDTLGKYSGEEKAEFLKKAFAAYKQALEIKPEYFEALYNIGALYYNEAARLLKEADKLPLNKTKEFEEMTNKAMDQFKLALPYMEKAHGIDAEDRSTLQTLVTIYHKLQKYDKAYEAKKKDAQDKLNNLPEEKSGL